MSNRTYYDLCQAILEVFPDETLQIGQRLTKRQVEMLNQFVVEFKEKKKLLGLK